MSPLGAAPRDENQVYPAAAKHGWKIPIMDWIGKFSH